MAKKRGGGKGKDYSPRGRAARHKAQRNKVHLGGGVYETVPTNPLVHTGRTLNKGERAWHDTIRHTKLSYTDEQKAAALSLSTSRSAPNIYGAYTPRVSPVDEQDYGPAPEQFDLDPFGNTSTHQPNYGEDGNLVSYSAHSDISNIEDMSWSASPTRNLKPSLGLRQQGPEDTSEGWSSTGDVRHGPGLTGFDILDLIAAKGETHDESYTGIKDYGSFTIGGRGSQLEGTAGFGALKEPAWKTREDNEAKTEAWRLEHPLPTIGAEGSYFLPTALGNSISGDAFKLMHRILDGGIRTPAAEHVPSIEDTRVSNYAEIREGLLASVDPKRYIENLGNLGNLTISDANKAKLMALVPMLEGRVAARAEVKVTKALSVDGSNNVASAAARAKEGELAFEFDSNAESFFTPRELHGRQLGLAVDGVRETAPNRVKKAELEIIREEHIQGLNAPATAHSSLENLLAENAEDSDKDSWIYGEDLTEDGSMGDISGEPLTSGVLGSMGSIVTYDIEATSADSGSARALSIAGIKRDVATGEVLGEYYSLINPEMQFEESGDAFDVHRITNAQVANAPKFGDIKGAFQEFIQGSILGGHNITGYDNKLLTNLSGDADYLSGTLGNIDTLALARRDLRIMGEVGQRSNLDDVARRAGVGERSQEWHEVRDDVRLEDKLLFEYINKGGHIANNPYGQLREAQYRGVNKGLDALTELYMSDVTKSHQADSITGIYKGGKVSNLGDVTRREIRQGLESFFYNFSGEKATLMKPDGTPVLGKDDKPITYRQQLPTILELGTGRHEIGLDGFMTGGHAMPGTKPALSRAFSGSSETMKSFQFNLLAGKYKGFTDDQIANAMPNLRRSLFPKVRDSEEAKRLFASANAIGRQISDVLKRNLNQADIDAQQYVPEHLRRHIIPAFSGSRHMEEFYELLNEAGYSDLKEDYAGGGLEHGSDAVPSLVADALRLARDPDVRYMPTVGRRSIRSVETTPKGLIGLAHFNRGMSDTTPLPLRAYRPRVSPLEMFANKLTIEDMGPGARTFNRTVGREEERLNSWLRNKTNIEVANLKLLHELESPQDSDGYAYDSYLFKEMEREEELKTRALHAKIKAAPKGSDLRAYLQDQMDNPELSPVQRTNEWFALRRGHITGSALGGMATMAGRSAKAREMALEEAMPGSTKFMDNYYTRGGNDMEESIARLFMKRFGNKAGISLEDASFVRGKGSLKGFGVSPDKMMYDNKGKGIGVLEIKYLSQGTYSQSRHKYEDQVQLQLAVLGLDTGYLMVYNRDLRTYKIEVIKANLKRQARIVVNGRKLLGNLDAERKRVAESMSTEFGQEALDAEIADLNSGPRKRESLDHDIRGLKYVPLRSMKTGAPLESEEETRERMNADYESYRAHRKADPDNTPIMSAYKEAMYQSDMAERREAISTYHANEAEKASDKDIQERHARLEATGSPLTQNEQASGWAGDMKSRAKGIEDKRVQDKVDALVAGGMDEDAAYAKVKGSGVVDVKLSTKVHNARQQTRDFRRRAEAEKYIKDKGLDIDPNTDDAGRIAAAEEAKDDETEAVEKATKSLEKFADNVALAGSGLSALSASLNKGENVVRRAETAAVKGGMDTDDIMGSAIAISTKMNISIPEAMTMVERVNATAIESQTDTPGVYTAMIATLAKAGISSEAIGTADSWMQLDAWEMQAKQHKLFKQAQKQTDSKGNSLAGKAAAAMGLDAATTLFYDRTSAE